MESRAADALSAREPSHEGDAPAATPSHRPIRSFVLRQGRFSPAQREAYDALLPRFGIGYSGEPLDFSRVFGRRRPTILEIGFGMGETTAAIAASLRDHDFLAVDVHAPGVGALLKRIDTLGLDNIRVIRHDAVEVVHTMIAPGTLTGVHVFFPDPWPKKRHHKRRLLKGEFVHALALRLHTGGYLHVATDWEDYAQAILSTLCTEPLLTNTVETFAPRPDYRPLTKFEQRGIARGHGVWDLIFRRRAPA